MSEEWLARFVISAIFGAALAWGVYSKNDRELEANGARDDRQKYLPYIPSGLLPMFFLMGCVLCLVSSNEISAAKRFFTLCFGIFLHIGVYYAVLLLLLPVLRKRISARACALLWIIPNYLYLTATSGMELPEPLLVIHIPERVLRLCVCVWLTGFVGVLAWKTGEHLAFRQRILCNAVPVSDSDILEVWNRVLTEARIRKPKFQLVTSPNVKTPLSVGLFRSQTKVVLPVKNYSADELELILRHEIIHIAREDAWSKYYLVFCAAMCWFNPLMWIAIGKSTEDMELSCDETVLLNADGDTRKAYGTLLLDTAVDDRGFTTCLSASAKSMRQRLKGIMKPVSRYCGGIVVGVVLFVLFMTSGFTTFSFGERSGLEAIYPGGDSSGCHFRIVAISDNAGGETSDSTVLDEAAVHRYLSDLKLSELVGNYSYSRYDTRLEILMDTPEGIESVTLHDHVICVSKMYRSSYETRIYYVRDGLDWTYLRTLIA